MQENLAVVVTSIAGPILQLQALARGCQESALDFIVIGDEASPADFQLEGCRFFSLKAQNKTEFKLARITPTRHYARKNLGYLIALRDGANVIVETDDDNIPYEQFWDDRRRIQSVPTLADAGWTNIYRYFSDANIWPRGFPLNHIRDELSPFDSVSAVQVDCPIQQGLANENPDVDAIYRLISPGSTTFRSDRRIALAKGSWCPFNSQNTTWWQDAFPLMYLPAYCSFRMTDIWRSFVAQRIAWVNDWALLFHEPNVWQDRNEHDLMRDFRDEVPGYLHNMEISSALDKLELRSGVENTGENLQVCYEKLVSMKLIDPRELDLISAWLEDLKTASE